MEWEVIMTDTAEKSTIEQLVDNILETRFENLDQVALEHAKNRIIDIVGCIIGGAYDTGNLELVNLVKDWGGKQEATILIHGGKGPASNVAMVNCIMSRSFDFGPCTPQVGDITAGGHISETTVPTAITLGEVADINGKELITALLVGDDTASRVSAGNYDLVKLGKWAFWDIIGSLNPIGSVAIAGRLLGLNKRQLRNAFGIVLNHMGGTWRNVDDFTTSFKLLQGTTARDGITSAQLAKIGWTGPPDALFSKFGFYKLFGEGDYHNPQIITKDLGKKYYSDSTIKPYPCCRGTQSPMECALIMGRKYNIDARDILEVTLYMPRRTLQDFICSQQFKIGEFPHANANWSYQYTVANALLRKSTVPEHFTEKFIRDPEIITLINKVKLTELLKAEQQGMGTGSKLEITMKDGRVFSENTGVAKGDQFTNPLSKDEIIAKFWTNVEFSQKVTKKKAEKVLSLLLNLEELDSVRTVTQLLVP
jgi:2-methylcitrate dehydratase PrpD